MPDIPENLRTAVTDQAKARVRRDIQGYPKYLTPEAIDTLRASFPGVPPRVSRWEIDWQYARGQGYAVDVRYFARDDSFVVRSRWRKQVGEWRIVHAERLWAEGERRPGLLSRLAGSLLRLAGGRRRR